MRFLSHSVVLAGVTDISEHPAILQTNASHPAACDMQAVDFDEDGDLDLVMSKGPDPPREELDRIPSVEITESLMQEVAEFFALVPPLCFERYFERVLDELEERTGEQNPLQAFPDQVQQIADLDGDGRLDVLVAVTNSGEKTRRWRYFRRAAAGTFVEPWENPLAEIQPSSQKIHVADWNSDGLPDVLFVGTRWRLRVWSYYQHVVDRDLRRNSHFKMYEDIHLSPLSSFVVQDWNEDGFEDVMVVQQQSVLIRWRRVWKLRRYEFQPRHMKEVLGFSLNVNSTVVPAYDHHVDLSGFALVDWDRDGALDLLIASEIDGKLHFYPNLGEESAEHPFKNIQLKKQPDQDRTIWIFAKPMVVMVTSIYFWVPRMDAILNTWQMEVYVKSKALW